MLSAGGKRFLLKFKSGGCKLKAGLRFLFPFFFMWNLILQLQVIDGLAWSFAFFHILLVWLHLKRSLFYLEEDLSIKYQRWTEILDILASLSVWVEHPGPQPAGGAVFLTLPVNQRLSRLIQRGSPHVIERSTAALCRLHAVWPVLEENVDVHNYVSTTQLKYSGFFIPDKEDRSCLIDGSITEVIEFRVIIIRRRRRIFHWH